MKPLTKAVAVALIQVCLVCLLGAKLLYDRQTRPRAWFKAQRYDPNLPIRGRYLSLQIEVNDPRSPEETRKNFESELRRIENQNHLYPYASQGSYDLGMECGSIDVRGGVAIAVFHQGLPSLTCDNLSFVHRKTRDEISLRLEEPVLFFIPDTAKDPTHLPNGEELWVLATVPRRGPPRPIALGIKKAGETAIRELGLN